MTLEEYIIDDDNSKELLAQLKHENRRLKDELESLKRAILDVEENLDSYSNDLKMKDDYLKRAERKITSLNQVVEEKDYFINKLEWELGQLRDTRENLERRIRFQKNRERELTEHNQVLLLSVQEFTEKFDRAEAENEELKLAARIEAEDTMMRVELLNDLRRQVKVLEDEKASLQEQIININCGSTALTACGCFTIQTHSNNSSRISQKSDSGSVKNGISCVNLKEELLFAEIQEKTSIINDLEEKLSTTQTKICRINSAAKDIDQLVALWNTNQDIEKVYPKMQEALVKIAKMLDHGANGQSGENNPLTETAESVKVKEAVIHSQPVPNRSVESISIATQTDRILLAKALEEFSPLHNALDYKYSDIDMDLYRKMSSQNNQEDADKPDKESIVALNNNNKETTYTVPMNTSKDMLNYMNEDEENLAAVEGCIDNLIEDIHNIDAGVDIDGNCTLPEEEVRKKFDELSLAFRTDSMMLQKRLIIRKRLRDQAERNFEKEINLIQTKLNNLRCLCMDAELLEQLSDMKKLLEIIFATVTYLTGCAEAYGCVQNEEKMSAAVAVIIKYMEYTERDQSKASKSPDREKSDIKSRIQLLPILDDVQEESILRRRSVAALALNRPTKRRASIASVVRNSVHSLDDVNGSAFGSLSSVASGCSPGVIRKMVTSTPTKTANAFASGDHAQPSRKESRLEDMFEMTYVQDYGSRHSIGGGGGDYILANDYDRAMEEKAETQRSVLLMSGSFDGRLRTSSVASETLNVIDSLRSAIKWIVKNSRFQFPENIHQYVPFFITWFVIIFLVTIFLSGFFTGFSHCSVSQLLHTSGKAAALIPFCFTFVTLVTKNSLLRYMVLTALLIYAHNLYHTLHEDGVDVLLGRLGVQITSYSPGGAPV